MTLESFSPIKTKMEKRKISKNTNNNDGPMQMQGYRLE
jgi:hypothetical protein